MKIEELEKSLKDGILNYIYLLYGEETFLLETSVKKIKKIFGELVTGINFIEIDEDTIGSLMQEIQTPSFGFPKKMIIVKNSGLFRKETKKKGSASVKDLRDNLEKFLKNNIEYIKESMVLVFIEENVEKLNITKTVESLGGTICEFELQKPIIIEKRLAAICNAYKVKAEQGALEFLIETSGTSMQQLINEIRKLIEYVGENGTITRQDIEKLAIKSLDSSIFDLTDNLGKKNIKVALDVLNDLIYQKEPIQKILITLYNHFKKLYIVKLSEKYRKDLAQVMNLKPNQSFLLNKYRTQAKYFSEDDIRSILDVMIKLDTNYKIGLIDVNIGLETILCEYCS